MVSLRKITFFCESKGLAIIDCMMNLLLLFWAGEVTGHAFYKRIAEAHADTTLKYFIREDYSVRHAYRFSEDTDAALGEANYCGYSIGSYGRAARTGRYTALQSPTAIQKRRNIWTVRQLCWINS